MNKTKIGVLLILCGVSFLKVRAQTNDNPPQRCDQPPREERLDASQSLTSEQKALVKSILSKYNASSLTAADARAINEAFRAAGIRNGPGLHQAIKEAGFVPEKIGALAPPGRSGDEQRPSDRQQPNRPERGTGATERPGRGDGGGYSIEQAISDRAQLSTIAFSGLAFITGNFGAATFMPPGKVCDFFGFQYMRDIDAAGKGHNPMFLSRVAGNVLHILNERQRQLFARLAAEQTPQFEQLALKRMPLIKAFYRELDGTIPKGSSGLSREAVVRYVGDVFAFDAELSYRRAQVFGQVVASLTPEQKAAFAKMKFGDFNTWPDLDEREALNRPNPGASRFFPVAYMTYASEFFSWYAGSVVADTYFCPERHGTYFGSFYMKDKPAMGKRNYDISTVVTGGSGENFLKLLTLEQRGTITAIIERQRKPLGEIIEVRQAISQELRKFLTGDQPDERKVLGLGRRYGELDGELSWIYATAFAAESRTLTAEQRASCLKLRNLDDYPSAPAYLYSQPLQKVPALPDSDFLFSPATAAPVTTTGTATPPANAPPAFALRSPAVATGGQLPQEFTGFGASATLPLEWSGAPAATRSYAVVMHHVDPEGKTKWYWVLYNIPATVQRLPENVKGVGTLGNNSINGRTEYAPPHSKGSGPKTYIYTVYALSAPPQITVPPSQVSRAVLLAAMQDRILATAELRVVYSHTNTLPSQQDHD